MSITSNQQVINYNAHGKQDRLLLGILLMILGECFFVISGALIKQLASELPLVQIMFFRNSFGLLLVLLVLYQQGFSNLKTSQLNTQILRGLVGVTAMAFMVFSYSQLQLSEATLLKATTPIFIPLIALFVLNERATRSTWLAILLAFFGIIIVISPELSNLKLTIGWLAGICAALLAATAKVLVRKLGRTDSSTTILFYFALVGSLATLPFTLLQWHTMSQWHWLSVMALSLFATLGQFSLTKAYTIAPAGKIGLYGYSSLPLACLVGWFIWDESISTLLIFGMAMIVLAGVINFKYR